MNNQEGLNQPFICTQAAQRHSAAQQEGHTRVAAQGPRLRDTTSHIADDEEGGELNFLSWVFVVVLETLSR